MDRVLPVVIEIAQRFPERTVFTRFITPKRPEDMPGAWQRYYGKWRETTREHLDPELLELVPSLARLVHRRASLTRCGILHSPIQLCLLIYRLVTPTALS